MPVDRTWYNTLVDDDGSGTVGTLWNKAAVDALITAVDTLVTFGNWTPIDSSGAGLTFTYPTGATWVRIGRLVVAQAGVLWPATANAAQALIGGLPYTSISFQGGGLVSFTTLGVMPTLIVGASDTRIQLFNLAGAAYLNSAMSGKDLRFTAIYQAV